MCRPLLSIRKWWNYYLRDSLERYSEFKSLRRPSEQHCLVGDSKRINLLSELRSESPALARMVEAKKFRGVFSSPPYVGLINYHEQHAYAYELFGLDRQDDDEIGPLSGGQGRAAQNQYVEGIASSLKSVRPFLATDFDAFLVANDKHDLYPSIAAKAGMRIANRFKRPVLNRTEKNRNNAYCELIFHLKDNCKNEGKDRDHLKGKPSKEA